MFKSLTLMSAVVASVLAQANQFTGIPSVGVLFTNDISKHFCTASVVQSNRGNVILTAGHCISGTGAGLKFAPGYHDGVAPYGIYDVNAAYVAPSWNSAHGINYDFSFLTLNPARVNGKTVNVQQVTGGNVLKTGTGFGHRIEVVGYNDGEQRPRQCSTTTFQVQSGQQGFKCGPFSGGTSGSPWITNYNSATQRGEVIGNIGGLHTGGCSASASNSPAYYGAIQTAYTRANAGSKGDVVRGGASSGC
ncbi:hypothetical protein CPB97_000082 [Podila verticillata]|nr:hypothetical protein CPB97_000082 [Podila verticillata]